MRLDYMVDPTHTRREVPARGNAPLTSGPWSAWRKEEISLVGSVNGGGLYGSMHGGIEYNQAPGIEGRRG